MSLQGPQALAGRQIPMFERPIGTYRQAMPSIKTHTHRGDPIGMSRTTVQEALSVRGAFMGHSQRCSHFIEAGRMACDLLQGCECRWPIAFLQMHLSKHVRR